MKQLLTDNKQKWMNSLNSFNQLDSLQCNEIKSKIKKLNFYFVLEIIFDQSKINEQINLFYSDDNFCLFQHFPNHKMIFTFILVNKTKLFILKN